jgi:hypothetical protein
MWPICERPHSEIVAIPASFPQQSGSRFELGSWFVASRLFWAPGDDAHYTRAGQAYLGRVVNSLLYLL